MNAEAVTGEQDPIFIVGCGRSGTTLLRLILNQHSRIGIPGETWFFPEVHKEKARIEALPDDAWRDELMSLLTRFPTFKELGVDEDRIRSTLNGVARGDWAQAVTVANRSFALSEGKTRWGDKTPGYIRNLPLIHDWFPRAFVLHMIRDGRDVALSIAQYRHLSPDNPNYPGNITEAARYWKSQVELGRRDGPKLFGERYVEIVYEDLVRAPEEVVRRLCRTLGEPFETGMLESSRNAERYVLAEHVWHEQVKRPISTGRSWRWKKEMSARDLRLFEAEAGPLLRELGYPAGPVWRWRAALLQLWKGGGRAAPRDE